MRNLRFGTEAGTSLIDGKPALLMYYGAYNEGNTLIDEIRRLSLRPLFPGRWQPQYLVFTDGRASDEGARLSQDHIRV